MSTFQVYFELGLKHIADIQGYDHILFVIALCATYTSRQIKEILILVTAFTVGHSVTLALAALKMIPVNASLIELLIPITILITSLYNVSRKTGSTFTRWKYAFALFFGLIHGMGFSNYFRTILGREADLTLPLFAFNIGLEVGQVLIVLSFMLIAFLALNLGRVRTESWIKFISGATAGVSVTLIIEQLFG